jgi:heme oxygenase
LLADLEVLGISQEAAATVNAAAIPQVQTLAQVLGSLYVLEGSTLGGQLLTRHFEKSLGLRGGAGCSFFASYGNDVGKMWTEFRNALVNHADPSTHPEIIESAIETFRLVHAALCAEKGVAEVVTASH